jgi:hypothetical protein
VEASKKPQRQRRAWSQRSEIYEHCHGSKIVMEAYYRKIDVVETSHLEEVFLKINEEMFGKATKSGQRFSNFLYAPNGLPSHQQ